jgi:multiple sugar transport system permease protein
MAVTNPTAPRRRRSLLWREHIDGYIFILPWMIGFFIFIAGPMVASLLISFMEWEIVTPPRWSGLGQYERLFQDKHFYLSLYNTAYYVFIGVPLHLLLALFAAMAMNLNLRGIRIYRTLYFIPSITPVVASSLLWLWIFNPDFGLANSFLNWLGLPSLYWLQDPKLAKAAFIIMSFWTIGGQMVILLAGLKGIPAALYEAAQIDGAGNWASFWNI